MLTELDTNLDGAYRQRTTPSPILEFGATLSKNAMHRGLKFSPVSGVCNVWVNRLYTFVDPDKTVPTPMAGGFPTQTG